MSNRYGTTGETAGHEEIHSITTTAEPHTQDMGHRMKVYATQMGLRIVCLLVFVAVDNFWVRAVALVGVAVLPWIAVLLANSGADRSARTSHYYVPPAVPALEAAPARRAEPPALDLVLEGEFTAGHGEDEGPGRGPGSTAAPSGTPASSARVEGDPSGPGGSTRARP